MISWLLNKHKTAISLYIVIGLGSLLLNYLSEPVMERVKSKANYFVPGSDLNIIWKGDIAYEE